MLELEEDQGTGGKALLGFRALPAGATRVIFSKVKQGNTLRVVPPNVIDISDDETEAPEPGPEDVAVAPAPATLQEFVGVLEKFDDDVGVLLLKDGQLEMRRAFPRTFLATKGIVEEGQPVELKIVAEQGDPKLILRPLGAEAGRRPYEIVEGLDYSQFTVLDE